MIVGKSVLGGSPLGYADGVPEDITYPDAAVVAFASGDAVTLELPYPTLDIASAVVVIGSGRTARAAVGAAPTTGSVAFSGGAVAIGGGVQVTSGQLSISGGTGSVGVYVTTTGASVAFAGQAANVGAAPNATTAHITFSGSDPDTLIALELTAASLGVSGGQAQASIGFAPSMASIGFAGNAVTVGLVIQPSQAIIWLVGGGMPEAGETPQGLVVVLNANTLAVSEYSIAPLDVVEHAGEVYFLTAGSLTKLDTDAPAASGYIQTGSLGLNSPMGRRCTMISVDTLSEEMPVVTTIDQDDAEYTTIPRRGAGTKRLREFDAPRGVLYSRIGVKVAGEALSVRGLTIRPVDNARR